MTPASEEVRLAASLTERAALVILLRGGRRPRARYAELVEQAGSALAILQEELGLLAHAAATAQALDHATAEIAAWHQRGVELLTVLDPGYPDNLREVHDRPPAIFVTGTLSPQDANAVAVIGTRQPTSEGLRRAREITEHLVQSGYTVLSGLAAGIDTAAHTAALAAGGRTIAVLGTGLDRCYPPGNAALQRRIAARCALVSQFWPDAAPSRRSFPMRNAVMSGLALGTVLVEAGERSGARTQARLALAHGRPVFLPQPLLAQPWARDLAARPGTYVIGSPAQLTDTVGRLTSPGALVA
jgi:DNA processing protein